MASIAASQPHPPWGNGNPPRVVRFWSEKAREKQRARLQKLRTRQIDECRDAGQKAWDEVHKKLQALPKEVLGADGKMQPLRIDLPSADVFALVLGVFRAAATLSKGDGRILRLELAAKDIAGLVRRSKSTVEAALRWLGCGQIEYRGVKYCPALGWLHRCRRYGRGYLNENAVEVERPILRWLHRTSLTVLTLVGRLVLGLPAAESRRRRPRRNSEIGNLKDASEDHQRVSTDAALRAKQQSVDQDDVGGGVSAEEAAAARVSIREKLQLV